MKTQKQENQKTEEFEILSFCHLRRAQGGCAALRPLGKSDFVQILWKNLFRKVSVLDSVLFYKIDLFLIFRHVFFYK